MHKIKTIFERDWRGKRGVIDKYVRDDLEEYLGDCFATEKLDGANVRVTVRAHKVVRIEKRKNPSKEHKAAGMVEPWYIDTNEDDSSDKYMIKAVRNTDFSKVDDGSHSAEAVGPKIQGNPLNLVDHRVFIFGTPHLQIDGIFIPDVPVTFEGLREWLPKQKSRVGNDCGIEGIVWYRAGMPFYKIKLKDFK